MKRIEDSSRSIAGLRGHGFVGAIIPSIRMMYPVYVALSRGSEREEKNDDWPSRDHSHC